VEGSIIASISLGESRDFQLRHVSTAACSRLAGELRTKANSGIPLSPEEKVQSNYDVKYDTEHNRIWKLNHGDLFLMGGQLQKFWRHRIPKTKEEIGPRINLTFRLIKKEFLQ